VIEKTIIIFRKQKNLKFGLLRFFKKTKNLGFLKVTSTALILGHYKPVVNCSDFELRLMA